MFVFLFFINVYYNIMFVKIKKEKDEDSIIFLVNNHFGY